MGDILSQDEEEKYGSQHTLAIVAPYFPNATNIMIMELGGGSNQGAYYVIVVQEKGTQRAGSFTLISDGQGTRRSRSVGSSKLMPRELFEQPNFPPTPREAISSRSRTNSLFSMPRASAPPMTPTAHQM